MKEKFTWRKGMKLVSLLTAVTLMLGVAAGCGDKASDKDDQGRTIITAGGYPQSEGKNRDNWDAGVRKFEEENPDLSIVGDPWKFERKSFYAKAAGGQLPVVYNAGFTEMKEVIDAGYAADITEALKKNGVYDSINKDILELVSKDGKVYAYPCSAYTLGLAVNVSDFEKAGLMNEDGTPQQIKTWDELTEVAVKLKEVTGKPGFIFPTANNNGGWLFTQVAWSYGTKFMEKGSDGKWKATFNSPECAEALQWIKDLKWKYDVLPVNTFIDGTELFKIFGIGGASMVISAGDITGKVVSYDMNPDDIGMMAIPAGPKGWYTLLGGGVHLIKNGSTKDQIDGGVRWIKNTYRPDATEASKLKAEQGIQKRVESNELVTVKSMSYWNNNSTQLQFEHELADRYANGNPAHVKLYNDFVANPGECVLRTEEPVCCQELYGILDNCIQEVFTNKDADPASVLEKANSDFQHNYLDNVDY